MFWVYCFIKLLYYFLVFSKWSQALHLSQGCFKCISGKNLSLASKYFYTASGMFFYILMVDHNNKLNSIFIKNYTFIKINFTHTSFFLNKSCLYITWLILSGLLMASFMSHFFYTLVNEINSLWLTFESIKVLEVKRSVWYLA